MNKTTITDFSGTSHSYGFGYIFGMIVKSGKRIREHHVNIWKGMSAEDAAKSLRLLAQSLESKSSKGGWVNVEECIKKAPAIYCRDRSGEDDE